MCYVSDAEEDHQSPGVLTVAFRHTVKLTLPRRKPNQSRVTSHAMFTETQDFQCQTLESSRQIKVNQ